MSPSCQRLLQLMMLKNSFCETTVFTTPNSKNAKKKKIHRYLVVSEAIIAPLRKRKEQQKIIVV